MTRQEGFSLVELLLASLITVIVVAGAFELAAPAQRMFQAQPEAADMQQRMRVAVDALRRDLVCRTCSWSIKRRRRAGHAAASLRRHP